MRKPDSQRYIQNMLSNNNRNHSVNNTSHQKPKHQNHSTRSLGRLTITGVWNGCSNLSGLAILLDQIRRALRNRVDDALDVTGGLNGEDGRIDNPEVLGTVDLEALINDTALGTGAHGARAGDVEHGDLALAHNLLGGLEVVALELRQPAAGLVEQLTQRGVGRDKVLDELHAARQKLHVEIVLVVVGVPDGLGLGVGRLDVDTAAREGRVEDGHDGQEVLGLDGDQVGGHGFRVVVDVHLGGEQDVLEGGLVGVGDDVADRGAGRVGEVTPLEQFLDALVGHDARLVDQRRVGARNGQLAHGTGAISLVHLQKRLDHGGIAQDVA